MFHGPSTGSVTRVGDWLLCKSLVHLTPFLTFLLLLGKTASPSQYKQAGRNPVKVWVCISLESRSNRGRNVFS